jgi:hypothetical protein
VHLTASLVFVDIWALRRNPTTCPKASFLREVAVG